MPTIGSQTGLQPVISGSSGGFLLVDKEEITEGPGHVEIHAVGAVEPTDRTVGRSEPTSAGSRGGSVPIRNLRLARLVDISEPEQLVSPGADITNLEHHSLAQLLLQVHVEVLGIGRANVLVGAKK